MKEQFMNSKNTLTVRAIALAVVATLAACGGGGGGGSTAAPVQTTPPASTVLSATLVSSVPAASYSGEQAIAFNLINAERSAAGFGLLAQNTALDASAAAHANFMDMNQNFTSYVDGNGHTEIAGNPGFTGATPADRAMAKGYQGYVGEEIASGTGVMAVRLLLSGPYHLRGLMDGFRDFGLGFGAPGAIPESTRFVTELGVQKLAGGNQLLSSTDVKTYPYDGAAGVNFQLRGETPSPVPDRNLSANPIGTPIFIKVREGNVLAITSATMIKVSTGAAITLRAPVSAANDPNKVSGVSYYRANEAYIAPDAALEKGTAYQTTIVGTNAGASFSRTINFTTGTGVN